MTGQIDTTFDFRTDTPPGKDPDVHSPTLRRYHRLLWSKPLPTGPLLSLVQEPREYLVYRSDRSSQFLSSDAITTRLLGRAAHLIRQIPEADLPHHPGYTIGSSIVFPGRRVNGQRTINGARGLHPRISDRFDLTLECIRRHYRGESSPLSGTLLRYSEFFDLFGDFAGYVQFFLLHDLLDDEGRIRFFLPFSDFGTPAVPQVVDQYLAYLVASNDFIQARNLRIGQLGI